MKNILFVEDDEYKLTALVAATQLLQIEINIEIARSLTSAVHFIKQRTFDLIVLDMSLPTYDSTDAQTGGDAQGFGGRRLVRIAEEYGNASPTVLVTQFTTYEDLGKSLTVADLTLELEKELGPYFLGTVIYDRSSQDWIPIFQSYIYKSLNI